MLVWFYRPKNIIYIIGGTFFIFVFIQVFVLVPNPDEKPRERSDGDKNRSPAERNQKNWMGDKDKLEVLKNINLNIKRQDNNEDDTDTGIHFEALKPLYDAVADTDFEDPETLDLDTAKNDRRKEIGSNEIDVMQRRDDENAKDDSKFIQPEAPAETPRPIHKRIKPAPQQTAPKQTAPPRQDEIVNMLEYMQKHIGMTGEEVSEGLTVPQEYNRFTDNCTVLVKNYKMKSPFKIYILDLPPRYNTDLVGCLQKVYPDGCFKTSHCGFGPPMYTEYDKSFSAHDSWQFSLEIIMHHKLLLSPYRTLKMEEAAVIYVPYYAALDCFCSMKPSTATTVDENIKDLLLLLRRRSDFISKKPHLMTLGKIEREHMTSRCPWLSQPALVQELTYIGIEQEVNSNLRFQHRRVPTPLILAPYPSYGHLSKNHGKDYVDNLYVHGRPVYVFLAAAARRSNPFRAKILDQFKGHMTSQSIHEFLKERKMEDGDGIKKVWLTTPECQGSHHKHTMMWMKHAIYCLQPPGDSPTRKSIYDAILSGCIPVFFKQEHPVKYPFQAKLDYSAFSVTIPTSTVDDNIDLYAFLMARYDREKIETLQSNLHQVVQNFQYSFPISNGDHDDAVQLILDELQERLHL